MKKLVTLVLALALVLCATAAMADPITLTYAEAVSYTHLTLPTICSV